MMCRRCIKAMFTVYDSRYCCWSWKCGVCGYAQTIAGTSDNQLSLEHEKGWR